jgi:ribosomal protein S18 acetylase RimI-like enzyme
MAVHPSFQRLGIGQKLLKAAIQHGQSLGFSHMHLHVDHKNQAAVNVYQAGGFFMAKNDVAHVAFADALMFAPEDTFLHMSREL